MKQAKRKEKNKKIKSIVQGNDLTSTGCASPTRDEEKKKKKKKKSEEEK